MVVRLLRYTLTQGYINFHRPLQRKKGSIHEVDDITVSVHLPVHKCLFNVYLHINIEQMIAQIRLLLFRIAEKIYKHLFLNSCPAFVVSNEIHLNMI